MELDAEDHRTAVGELGCQPAGALDGLDDAVGRAGHDLEALGHILDGLVVEGIHHGFLLAEDFGQQGTFLNVDRVGSDRAGRRALAMLDIARGDLRRNVLPEGTAEGDGQQLFAAADAQHGDALGDGGPDQFHVELVARGHDFAQPADRLFAEPFQRVEVFAAGHQDAVDGIEHGVELRVVRRDGNHQRHAAGLADGVDIGHVDVALSVFGIAGNADDRGLGPEAGSCDQQRRGQKEIFFHETMVFLPILQSLHPIRP